MKKLLKGGVIVGASGCRKADLLIDGERIEAVGEALSCPEAEEIDVSGKLLFPGFLDAHTHFDLEVCNTVTADDFYTGGRSALRGGTTTVIDFACPNKGETLHTGLARWHEKADGKTGCDYGFHMTIDDWNDGICAELPQMFDEGISSFKMYMTYPAMMIGDEAMFHALREMKRLGGIVGVHCENAGMIDALIAEKKAAGALSPASHPLCRPAEAEAEAVGRLLKLARVADVPVMIVHLSTAAALREVEAARGLGQKVFVETCPHYLLLDDSRYSLPDFAGARYVCAPPLRKKLDNERLWKALADGEIQTVSTDHCSFTRRRTPGAATSRKSPAACPAWRRAARCCSPTASQQAASRPSAWPMCWPKRPRSSTVSSPARACCSRARTRTSSYMTRAARAASPQPIRRQTSTMPLMRARRSRAISQRSTCAAPASSGRAKFSTTVMGSICTAENVCSKAASLHCSPGLHRLFFIWWSKTPIFELFFRQKWRVFRKNACSFFLQGV